MAIIVERIHYWPPQANKRGKAENWWKTDGVFLGRKDRSREIFDGASIGVETAVAFRTGQGLGRKGGSGVLADGYRGHEEQ